MQRVRFLSRDEDNGFGKKDREEAEERESQEGRSKVDLTPPLAPLSLLRRGAGGEVN